jgi:hypothetical protein
LESPLGFAPGDLDLTALFGVHATLAGMADGLNAAFMVEGNGEADDLTDRPPAVPSRRRSTAQSA